MPPLVLFTTLALAASPAPSVQELSCKGGPQNGTISAAKLTFYDADGTNKGAFPVRTGDVSVYGVTTNGLYIVARADVTEAAAAPATAKGCSFVSRFGIKVQCTNQVADVSQSNPAHDIAGVNGSGLTIGKTCAL